MVYIISQLVRLERICSSYEEFVKRNRIITSRLMKQIRRNFMLDI